MLHSKTKSILFILCLITFSTITTAQENLIFYPQGYYFQPLSGYGNSYLNNNVSEIGLLNPAALENYEGLTFGASYQTTSRIKKLFISSNYKDHINVFPYNAAVVFRSNNLKFGISYNHIYDALINDDIYRMYNDINLNDETRLFAFSGFISFSLNELLENSNLELGLKISRNLLKHENIFSEYSFNSNSFSIGLMHKLNFSDSKYLKTGLAYESKIKIEKPYTFYLAGTNNSKQDLSIPDRIKFSLEWHHFEKWVFSGDLHYINWEDTYNNINNAYNFAINGLYTINQNFKFSLGGFSDSRSYKEDFLLPSLQAKAIYLNLGFVYNSKYFDVDLVLADSHALSDDSRKETILKAAAAFKF